MSKEQQYTSNTLSGASRQYKHNDGSDGFVFGYDKPEIDNLVAQLNNEIKYLRENIENESAKNANYRQGYKDGKAFANRHNEISLRDWFAGLAMQGFIAADASLNLDEGVISHNAYSQADEMLKERSKGND